MRAAVLTAPNELRVEDRPQPTLPPGGLMVTAAYTGVCGSDVRNWRHGSSRLRGAQVPGHEVSGVVAASDVSGIEVGTRVAICPGAPCGRCRHCERGRHNLCTDRIVLGYDFPGGMAESYAIPPQSVAAGCVVPLPDHLGLRTAVLAEPLHTVINGQDLARIGADDSVLVIGLGTIGTLHAAHAASLGARVFAVDVRPERLAAASAILGDGRVGPIGDPAALRGADDWDVVILAAGAPAAFDVAMTVVGRAGRILAFAGLPPSAGTVPVDLNRVHYEQLELIGAFGGTPGTFRRAVGWLADTTMPIGDLITDEFPIDEAELAYRNVEAGNGVKTVLRGPAAD